MRPVGKHKYKLQRDIESDPNEMGKDVWGLGRRPTKRSTGRILICNVTFVF